MRWENRLPKICNAFFCLDLNSARWSSTHCSPSVLPDSSESVHSELSSLASPHRAGMGNFGPAGGVLNSSGHGNNNQLEQSRIDIAYRSLKA
jgi:hypothetical protein